MEWRPADFSSVGPLEVCLLLGFGLALYRGISLPPLRIVLLLGMLHMALSQGRSVEIFALLVPLFLACPLAKQIGAAARTPIFEQPRRHAACCSASLASLSVLLRGQPSPMLPWFASSRTPAARRSRQLRN